MRAADFSRLNLVTLRLFVAACEEQSISAAAAREHIAPSALSRRLSELERALGISLFRRHRRGLEPSPSALALLRHARMIMSGMALMADELAEHFEGMRGTIRLKANVWAITHYLPSQLLSFMVAHPNLVVDVEETLTSATIKAVIEQSADIGIIGSGVSTLGLHTIPYRQDKLVAVMKADHPLAKASALTLADLIPYDIIGAREGSALDQLIMTGAAKLGMALKIRIRISGFDAMYRLVEAGLGIGFGTSDITRRHSRNMNIIGVPVAEPWAERQLFLCVATNHPLSAQARMFLDHLLTTPSSSATGL